MAVLNLSRLVWAFLFSSLVAHALPGDQTSFVAVPSVGWNPRPTPAPVVPYPELLKRDVSTLGVCGWINGNSSYQCYTDPSQVINVDWTYSGQTGPINVPTFTGAKGISTGTQYPDSFSGPTPTPSSTSTSTSTSSSPSTTASTTSSKTSKPTETSSPPSTNIGAIVGGVVGGVALICITIVAIFLITRRRRHANASLSAASHPVNNDPLAAQDQRFSGQPPMGSQQPPYSPQMYPPQSMSPPPQGAYAAYPVKGPEFDQQAAAQPPYYTTGSDRHSGVGYTPAGSPAYQHDPVYEAPADSPSNR
ncbi:MAG: hypothetical protein M1840_001803 [Geoglossum simile]|nr:MAG: hypothetical protein M1840_001803 [Geoglossum simile]